MLDHGPDECERRPENADVTAAETFQGEGDAAALPQLNRPRMAAMGIIPNGRERFLGGQSPLRFPVP
jgi:hypothetical protein